MKRLYKTSTDKKVCGVCGGLGEYFGIDPTLLRVAWAVFALTGAGLLAYFIAAVIMPYDYEVRGHE